MRDNILKMGNIINEFSIGEFEEFISLADTLKSKFPGLKVRDLYDYSKSPIEQFDGEFDPRSGHGVLPGAAPAGPVSLGEQGGQDRLAPVHSPLLRSLRPPLRDPLGRERSAEEGHQAQPAVSRRISLKTSIAGRLRANRLAGLPCAGGIQRPVQAHTGDAQSENRVTVSISTASFSCSKRTLRSHSAQGRHEQFLPSDFLNLYFQEAIQEFALNIMSFFVRYRTHDDYDSFIETASSQF
jgi:hypothetical protein